MFLFTVFCILAVKKAANYRVLRIYCVLRTKYKYALWVHSTSMIGKLPDSNQRELFRPLLEDLINPQHKLALLAKAIDWQYFEDEFEPYYSY